MATINASKRLLQQAARSDVEGADDLDRVLSTFGLAGAYARKLGKPTKVSYDGSGTVLTTVWKTNDGTVTIRTDSTSSTVQFKTKR